MFSLLLLKLHQYPGYDATEITPLPDELPAVQILRKVSDAQVHLQKKVLVNHITMYRSHLFSLLAFPLEK
jgi:hypothetical protein